MHGDYLDLISDGFVNINWKSPVSERGTVRHQSKAYPKFPQAGVGNPKEGTNLLFLGKNFLKIA